MSGSAPEISILVVAYNSAEVIATCLASIAPACSQASYEVLLVDNGDLTTQALVERDFPFVQVVPSKGNVGFAAGNNLLAAEASGRYLLLLNPDVELCPGALDRLLEGVRNHPEAAAWGGVTLDRNGAPDKGNSVHVPSLVTMASRVVGRSIVRNTSAGTGDRDELVTVLSGAFVMFSRSAWDEVGGLDDRFFLYCEEVDLFYRLAQRGHVFWRIAASRCFHDIGHGADSSPMRELYLTAGTMQFALLHWSKERRTMAFLLLWLGSIQRYLSGSVLGHWRPSALKLREKHRMIALKPGYWRFGYDRERGLLVRLGMQKSQSTATDQE